jgi:hypothetical protein
MKKEESQSLVEMTQEQQLLSLLQELQFIDTIIDPSTFVREHTIDDRIFWLKRLKTDPQYQSLDYWVQRKFTTDQELLHHSSKLILDLQSEPLTIVDENGVDHIVDRLTVDTFSPRYKADFWDRMKGTNPSKDTLEINAFDGPSAVVFQLLVEHELDSTAEKHILERNYPNQAYMTVKQAVDLMQQARERIFTLFNQDL